MRKSCFVAVAAVVFSAVLPLQSFAQGPSSSLNVPESVVMSSSLAPGPDAAGQAPAAKSGDSGGVGIGVKFGTLGIGFQGAVAVASHLNVRGGFNTFNYSTTLTQSGTSFDASLALQSAEVNLDLLVGGGLRLSPGVLLYNNNHLDATLSVPGGSTFSIGDQTFTSLAAAPIGGAASMTFSKFSPMLAIGFGQLVPRSGRHFSMALDLGVVFEDAPTVAMTYSGTGCLVTTPALPAALACKPINTQANIVTNIAAEQQKVSDAVSVFKYYPVLSLGFGWRF